MKKREHKSLSAVLEKYCMIGPITLWMYLLVAIPFLYIIAISFMHKGTYGGVVAGFTLQNYKDILNPLYLQTFAKSIGMSIIVTLICLIIAYPFTYFVSQKTEIQKTIFMSMIMIPFCVSMIIRLFSWVNILRTDGVINNFFSTFGIGPFKLVYNQTGALIGLIYMLLPFMILPLYSSIEKLDASLLEAAQDLGAKPVISFLKVTLPLTKPGIFAGCVIMVS